MWRVIILLFIFSSACVEVKSPYSALAPGTYQAKLLLAEDPFTYFDEERVRKHRIADFPEISDEEIPFLFRVSYEDNQEMRVTLLNGEERIRVEDVSHGIDRSSARDTIRINFPEYQSYLFAEFSEDKLQGHFNKTYLGNAKIPFSAKFGELERFPAAVEEAAIDVSGNWEMLIEKQTGETYPALGEFSQDGQELSGTIVTETGDYGHLSGVVEGKQIWLSRFDGNRAYLFSGKMGDDGTLEGFFKSGKSTLRNWSAERNPEFKLEDPDSISIVANTDKDFLKTYPGISGELLGINTGRYKGKPSVVEIMGTWCPNCKDAGAFLKGYLTEHEDLELEVFALAFERSGEESGILQRIKEYRAKYEIPYDFAFAGELGPDSKYSLPWIEEIKSYPTLLFFGRENQLRRVYTGFYGPASEKHAEFQESFHKTVLELQ